MRAVLTTRFFAMILAAAGVLLSGCEPAEDQPADAASSDRPPAPQPADDPAVRGDGPAGDESDNPADDAEGGGDQPAADSTDADAPTGQPTADEEPLDLDARLAELRALQADGAFAKALRRARLLRGELTTIEQRQRLKPLLDELRRMNRQANRFELAIDRLSRGC